MEAPVTRRELHEELALTRDELRAEITSTRDELRAEITSTRDELRADITSTRDELRAEISSTRDALRAASHRDLEIWFGAFREEMRGEFEQSRRQAANDKQEILAVLGQHTTASAEQARADLRIIDDKYKMLPARTDRLEARVFPSAPKRSTRKQPKRKPPTK